LSTKQQVVANDCHVIFNTAIANVFSTTPTFLFQQPIEG